MDSNRSALRRAALALALALVSLAATAPLPAQAAESTPARAPLAPLLRVAFAGSPGQWTPELPRLASVLELVLAAHGLRVESREILAPGVVTLHGHTLAPARFTSRALRSLLTRRELAAWPGLQVLLSDADPEPHAWILSAELAFTLRKPDAATRETIDLARELAKRHLAQRGTPEASSEEMLRRMEFRLLYERPSPADPRRLDVRFAVRCTASKPEPLETARWLALFAPRTAIEIGSEIAAPDGVAHSVRAAPASASASEMHALVRAASGGACDVRLRRTASATPFRRAQDLSFVSSERRFDSSSFLELRAEHDALGAPALAWKLTPEAAQRAALADSAATWQLLVHGEVWGSVRPQELVAGQGVLFGSFENSDVELVSRAFAPLDPPALWIVP